MRCPIWQGGGVYIRGSSTVVTITLTSIYQNTASYVSFLPVLNQGPTTTPPWKNFPGNHPNGSQGGGVYIEGSSIVNINDCAIHNNQANAVSTRTVFEQRAHHNAPMEEPFSGIPDCPQLFTGWRRIHRRRCSNHCLKLYHQWQPGNIGWRHLRAAWCSGQVGQPIGCHVKQT